MERCAAPEQLPMGGKVLRAALNETEQLWLYRELYAMCKGTAEFRMLQETSSEAVQDDIGRRPQPFVSWLHPYTRKSTACARPTELLGWAQRLMHALAPGSASHRVDSMLAQLYVPGGGLLPHRDEDLSWGLGVSLGSTARFECRPDDGPVVPIVLESGDVLVGEFGLMRHAVDVPVRGRRPGWWEQVDAFRCRTRCNVLFRQALTHAEQRALAEERARVVYGMSLPELARSSGYDEGDLSVHLRHAALE